MNVALFPSVPALIYINGLLKDINENIQLWKNFVKIWQVACVEYTGKRSNIIIIIVILS